MARAVNQRGTVEDIFIKIKELDSNKLDFEKVELNLQVSIVDNCYQKGNSYWRVKIWHYNISLLAKA